MCSRIACRTVKPNTFMERTIRSNFSHLRQPLVNVMGEHSRTARGDGVAGKRFRKVVGLYASGVDFSKRRVCSITALNLIGVQGDRRCAYANQYSAITQMYLTSTCSGVVNFNNRWRLDARKAAANVRRNSGEFARALSHSINHSSPGMLSTKRVFNNDQT